MTPTFKTIIDLIIFVYAELHVSAFLLAQAGIDSYKLPLCSNIFN